MKSSFLMMLLLTVLAGCHGQKELQPKSPQSLTTSEITSMSVLIDGASIRQLQKYQADGELSAESLTAYYIDRINQTRNTVNAVIAINPHALEDATNLDQVRKRAREQGEPLGPLHGVPILVKDNIETFDMPTTAGSLYLKENHTGRDAPLVARLRQAGAIILGKANLSEWANFRSTQSSSGWSAMGGQTRNPHDLTRSPCGSSSGSGAAVAANLAAAAIGTDTWGSIICPGSAMGIVGIKPTVGLVSRTHIIPISNTLDTAGPMARTVADAALLLSVLAGFDPEDSATDIVRSQQGFDYRSSLEGACLQNVRLGIFRPDTEQIHVETLALFLEALNQLKESGATLKDAVPAESTYPEFLNDAVSILKYELKQGLSDYFQSLPVPLSQFSLKGLIRFNNENAATEMPYFGQELLEQSLLLGGLEEPGYTTALDRVQSFTRKTLDHMFLENKVDVLVMLSMDQAWPIDYENGDGGAYESYDFPSLAGYPHITLPMGKVEGLPVGLLLVARPLNEHKIISAAQVFERYAQQ